jgi:hypothetical protein
MEDPEVTLFDAGLARRYASMLPHLAVPLIPPKKGVTHRGAPSGTHGDDPGGCSFYM